MKLKLISCEVFFREFCHVVARSPHQIDLEFVPKGLHDMGQIPMRDRPQEAIDRVDTSAYDALLLGYGLCNFGINGLRSPALPMVVPRAHDCMTLFFGSQERYLENFQSAPGTYYLTTGWMERGEPSGEFKQLSIQHQSGMDKTFEELVELYGEDNARYLLEQLGDQTRHYTRIAFIEMGIEPDDSFFQGAEQRAKDRNLTYERLQGDMRLFLDLVNGNWNDRDFLTVPAGHRIGVSEDGQRIFAQADGQ
jgi:hypothetical protein